MENPILLQLRRPPIVPCTNNYFYKSKMPGLLTRFKKFAVARNSIEIIPFVQDHFNIASFLNFCMVIDHDFKLMANCKKYPIQQILKYWYLIESGLAINIRSKLPLAIISVSSFSA